MDECTEPGCRSPVKKSFKGKMLCQDCYEKYKEAEDRMLMELRSM
jgi:hypothetical protein